MAYTATLRRQGITGNQRMAEYYVVADAASGAVQTALGFIDSIAVAPASMATAGGKFKANLSAASATAAGSVFVSSIANGDEFFLTVFGRS